MNSEFHGTTTIHPIGLAAVLVLGVATLLLPRRYAALPFIVMACFVSPAQRVVVAGLDFNFIRLLVLFGWMRVFARREYTGFQWKPIDVVLILWALTGTAAYTITNGGEHLVTKLGSSYDALGLYFFFRWVIRTWRDVYGLAITFAVVSAPVMFAFAAEWMTGKNAFSIFGGVRAETQVRGGRLRAQGAFSHPILAGCFWAAAAPLIASLWWRGGSLKMLSVTGVCCAMMVVVFCASSTPLASVAAGLVGAAMFPLRAHMRTIRWGVVGMLVMLHFVMNKPVWHLIARIDLVGGSTGWHRYHLIDAAIRNFGEWAVAGTPSTAHWGWGLQDVTNQYVLEAVRGGFITLVLFVVTIGLAFGAVGRALRAAPDRARLVLVWCVGVSLFVHCISFIAVSYFGQTTMLWYLGLAAAVSVGVITQEQKHAKNLARRRAKRQRVRETSALARPIGALQSGNGRAHGF